jgi:hypothetical protein
MEEMWLYQMLHPNINSSRVWQIGCAKQTMIETRGAKFVIGHEALQDGPCWSVSLDVRPQKNAPHWRTLSHATDFDHQGSQ